MDLCEKQQHSQLCPEAVQTLQQQNGRTFLKPRTHENLAPAGKSLGVFVQDALNKFLCPSDLDPVVILYNR